MHLTHWANSSTLVAAATTSQMDLFESGGYYLLMGSKKEGTS